jgi:putative transposase
MAQYQITLNDDSLKDLFQQDGGVAKLVEQVLNQVLQAQVTEQLMAAPYERTDERQGYRNGTVSHTLTTRVGRLTLRVARVRNGQFSTELFARYQRSEQALVLALIRNVLFTRPPRMMRSQMWSTTFLQPIMSMGCEPLQCLCHAPPSLRHLPWIEDRFVSLGHVCGKKKRGHRFSNRILAR